MSKKIFVNLPVADLQKAQSFYEAIGAVNNLQFSDNTAVCMVVSDSIYVMLLTHPKWATFTQKPIVAAASNRSPRAPSEGQNRSTAVARTAPQIRPRRRKVRGPCGGTGCRFLESSAINTSVFIKCSVEHSVDGPPRRES